MSLDKLPYLIDEICAAVEIYYTGRQGGQYVKTAFILCDDYTELTAKLFLLIDNRRWSDKKPTSAKSTCASPTCGRTAGTTTAAGETFKNYHDVLADVESVFQKKFSADLVAVQAIHNHFRNRRNLRNEFFHSTRLLDLGANQRGIVDAFCDLFAYGQLLFKDNWQKNVEASRHLDTMYELLRLEKASFSNPLLWPRAMEIIRNWPRNKGRAARTGVHMTEYPEDMHLRLCITHGGRDLRDKLRALLTA
jgi:hypothetical protein